MKPIDDEKIKTTNNELEQKFDEERTKWKEDIISLLEMTKNNSKLAESQVIQLSYRQIIQEQIAKYRIFLEKSQESFDKQYTQRFRDYTIGYDIKLSGSEKQIHIYADCHALRLRVKLLDNQIKYLEECVKTLDNLGFSIKNKIDILSQQLV